jgi:hypothetical protein
MIPMNLDQSDRFYILGIGSETLGFETAARHRNDDWDAKDATGWSYDEALPQFSRLERSRDFQCVLHRTTKWTPQLCAAKNLAHITAQRDMYQESAMTAKKHVS